jgi:hypothetical protein
MGHNFLQAIRELEPLVYEHLVKRETPLVVEAYEGDITKMDPSVLNLSPPLYAVLSIEVIEHLEPEVLLGFEKTVFGLLSPPLVILTTPNSDFNTVFKLEKGKFRHWDHKFEWTRAEFRDWCLKICSQYSAYTFETSGIGEGAEGTEAFGAVSQMAVFTKAETQAETDQDREKRSEEFRGEALCELGIGNYANY